VKSPARHLIANLTCEDSWARRRPQLSARALATVAGLATLLRAFARDGDVLHLPAAVDPARLPEVPGLPIPRLASGKLERLASPAAVVAWGETAEVVRHRTRGLAGSTAEPNGMDLADLLWDLTPPSPEAAARANHRGFCLETAEASGVALPGARMVSSIGEIEDAVGQAYGQWILKAPLSAAGRDRAPLAGRADLRPGGSRNRLDALLARHGELLLEPWMERTEDFGVSAILAEGDLRIVAFHRQRLEHGQPAGFVLPVTWREITGLSPKERQELDRVLDGVAVALRRIGYRGPFGLDLWRHRAASGEIRFHPLGEINARMTLGLVARALVDRLRGPLGWDPQGEAELILAAAPPAAASAIPLLTPGPEGALGAWIGPGRPPG
jgi:hypothetical protein